MKSVRCPISSPIITYLFPHVPITPPGLLSHVLCLVFAASLGLSYSCSISHLYKELSAHSNSHSDESVWIKGCSRRPKLMLLIHIRNVWNAERLHTPEPQHKTLTSFTGILSGSDVHSDGPAYISLLLLPFLTSQQLKLRRIGGCC